MNWDWPVPTPSASCAILFMRKARRCLRPMASDFYAGRPALTVNRFGKGRAYYITSRNEDKFHGDFYKSLVTKLGSSGRPRVILRPCDCATGRTDGDRTFVFC